MGATAARAVVDGVFAIDGVIAAKIRVEVVATRFNPVQHGVVLEKPFDALTSVESLGFSDEEFCCASLR
jgi:hypothetical protein